MTLTQNPLIKFEYVVRLRSANRMLYQKKGIMQKLISLHEQLIIHKITYETSQSVVTAECEIIRQGRKVRTSFLISHTDLNRILSRLISKGYDLDSSFYQSFQFEDGTEVVDCLFDQFPEGPVVLEEFSFNDLITEIRA